MAKKAAAQDEGPRRSSSAESEKTGAARDSGARQQPKRQPSAEDAPPQAPKGAGPDAKRQADQDRRGKKAQRQGQEPPTRAAATAARRDPQQPAPPKPARPRAAAPAASARSPRRRKPAAASRGRTNPMPTKRSTGTAAGAGGTRRRPVSSARAGSCARSKRSSRARRPASTWIATASAARTRPRELQQARARAHRDQPGMTAGDVDADWEDAYAVGDEAPGGDNPTPDQDRVDDIGKALGVEYQDNEELKASDKIAERDKHRWELDPASAEDYKEHDDE